MNLDFLEIGTSNFRTLLETATDSTIGISVEPLSHYLNQLPNKKNVIKENIAIAFNNLEKQIEIYYVPENIIKEKNLPAWLKGCNSLSTYHPKHIELDIVNLVKIEHVLQIPISNLLEKYKVESLNFLKIDTEGGDCDILLHLQKYLDMKGSKSLFPKKIQFESNSLTEKTKIQKVLHTYEKSGYRISKKKKTDIVLVLDTE